MGLSLLLYGSGVHSHRGVAPHCSVTVVQVSLPAAGIWIVCGLELSRVRAAADAVHFWLVVDTQFPRVTTLLSSSSVGRPRALQSQQH